MRFTHDAQVMPSMGSWISVAAASRPVGRHTPGEYSSRHPRGPAGEMGTLDAVPPVEIALVTLAGPWGPYVVAATERGVVAAEWATTEDGSCDGPASPTRAGRGRRPTARLPTSWRRSCHRSRPSSPASRCDGRGDPDRSRRPPALRPASCSARSARSAGARRRATGRSPGGSARRGRRAPSAARSGATRSRSSSRAIG